MYTNIIAPFWNTTLRRIFNITTPQPTPGVLPRFLQELDFANTNTTKDGWYRAFFLVKVLQPFVNSTASLDAQISAQLQFVGSIANFTNPQID